MWNGIYNTMKPLLDAFKYLFETIWQAIQILIGAAVYLGGSALLKLDTFEYLWNVVKPKIQRKPWADNEE